MTRRVTSFWICRYCEKKVRVRKDGYSARHSGINRFGKNSASCVGALYPVTTAAHQAEKKKLAL